MVASRLTLTNRPENLRLLEDFISQWSKDRGLPAARLRSLELAAKRIFRHLVDHAYQPGEPGSIAVELEEKGPRLRLMFGDDAVPNIRLNLGPFSSNSTAMEPGSPG